MRHRPLAPRAALVARVMLACAALLFLANAVVPHSGELSNGFAAYYTSAWLAAHGADVRRFYDDDWFRAQIPRSGIEDIQDIYNVNPPATALLFLPLVPLSPRMADHAWSALNVALLVAGLTLLWRALRPWIDLPEASRTTVGLALAGITLVYSPLFLNMRQGQVYLLLLLLAVVALRGYLRDDDRLLGLALGALLVLKGAGALLWLAPLLDRRWRALAYGAGALASTIILATPLLGLSAWWTYLTRLPDLFDRPWTGVTAYQTLSSVSYHLTRADPTFSPQPLIDAPWLARPLASLLSVVATLAVVGVGWLFTRDDDPIRRRLLRFALLCAVSVPLQPVGEEHHYLLALPAVWVALGLAAITVTTRDGSTRAWLCLPAAVAGSVLLIAPIPFRSTTLRDGWHALGAYPKLYGAALLALALAAMLAASPREWPALVGAKLAAVRPHPDMPGAPRPARAPTCRAPGRRHRLL